MIDKTKFRSILIINGWHEINLSDSTAIIFSKAKDLFGIRINEKEYLASSFKLKAQSILLYGAYPPADFIRELLDKVYGIHWDVELQKGVDETMKQLLRSNRTYNNIE